MADINTEKIDLRKQIISAANIYKHNLAGNVYLYVYGDTYFEVAYMTEWCTIIAPKFRASEQFFIILSRPGGKYRSGVPQRNSWYCLNMELQNWARSQKIHISGFLN